MLARPEYGGWRPGAHEGQGAFPSMSARGAGGRGGQYPERVNRIFVVVIAMIACACSDANEPEPPLLPTAQITVSSGEVSRPLTVELATTPSQRQQGLMYRQSMAEDRGMLFLFEQDINHGFWMKNTYIPLDIAYLAPDGTVLEIVKGEPLNTDPLTPQQPYRHALEVNQGWFEENGLGPGAKVSIPDVPLASALTVPTPTATAVR